MRSEDGDTTVPTARCERCPEIGRGRKDCKLARARRRRKPTLLVVFHCYLQAANTAALAFTDQSRRDCWSTDSNAAHRVANSRENMLAFQGTAENVELAGGSVSVESLEKSRHKVLSGTGDENYLTLNDAAFVSTVDSAYFLTPECIALCYFQ